MKMGRMGFAQVEPNHLSGIVEGKILAQLPVDKEKMGDIIENGRFAKYDYTNASKSEHKEGCVTTSADALGEWMLIYNEEKLYDERFQSHKDFAMIADNYTEREIVPRLISTEVGDIMTTNAFGMSEGKNSRLRGPFTDFENVEPDVDGGFEFEPYSEDLDSMLFGVGEDGYLTQDGYDEEGPVWAVAKRQSYTMPDGQPGLKLIRVK